MKPLPAISLWQPWASFFADGLKIIETRHWQTKFRGRLVIHAAKTTEALTLTDCYRLLDEAGRRDLIVKYTRLDDWPRGCLIAVADMVDCVPTEQIVDRLDPQERAMGNYLPGRFAWVFKNIRKLDPPITCKGQQGFWTLSPLETAAVLKLLGEAA